MPVTIKAAHLKYKNEQGEYVGVNSVSDQTISLVVSYLEQITEVVRCGIHRIKLRRHDEYFLNGLY